MRDNTVEQETELEKEDRKKNEFAECSRATANGPQRVASIFDAVGTIALAEAL
ncbi:hypothetical protein H920_17418 [Fukomys damarensis]|uniref:Uncharacterized protein n=1 Tax=Fukomys damarensis TaxID=885580 RepID=A0A091CTF0_FUKDA|nr:hypothetical protein H920_17418 [Fukomys damarensis]